MRGAQVAYDFDFTIAHYNDCLGYTIYELAKQHLVRHRQRRVTLLALLTKHRLWTRVLQVTARQYPESLSALKYDPEFAVRSLATRLRSRG